jgi:regulator of sigma E protease
MLSTILIFILLIGVLVFVHELGHFITARWTGMRADVFAVGMGPRMLGWNPKTGFSVGSLPPDLELEGQTDYRLCWLPIGGYVKIIGMVDESLDTDHLEKAPEPWEFRSKKNWQKALVLSGGVIMNILLAIGIFAGLSMIVGEKEHLTTTVAYVDPGSPMSRGGLTAGDRIVAVNGVAVDAWEPMMQSIINSASGTIFAIDVVTEQRQQRRLQIASESIMQSMAAQKGLGLYPSGMNVVLDAVDALRPAGRAGLKAGDVVLAIDTMPVRVGAQMQQYIRAHAGDTITMHVRRNDETMARPVIVGKDGLISVAIGQTFNADVRHVTYDPMHALTEATNQVGTTVAMIGSSFAAVFTGKLGVRQSFGGPIRIAEMAAKSSEMGLEPFLRFMALISISLAVMNILPLPGLDGGHLVFVGIEAVIRSEIPTSIKIKVQQVGIYMLLALMVFVFYLDLTR